MISYQWTFCLLFFVLLTQSTVASIQNVTIDDADNTLEYSGDWHTACHASFQQCPDPSQLYDGTLHWVSYDESTSQIPNVTLRFTGTAVYVYNVLMNDPSPAYGTVINLVLDGDVVESWSQPVSGTSGYTYHSLVYSNSDMSNREHVLVMQAARDASQIMFDYIEYTAATGDSTSLPPAPASSRSMSSPPPSSIDSTPPPSSIDPTPPLSSIDSTPHSALISSVTSNPIWQSSGYPTGTPSATPSLTVSYISLPASQLSTELSYIIDVADTGSLINPPTWC